MSPLDFGLTKPAYSINELLEMLPFGRTSLYGEIKRGRIKVIKRGKNTWALAPDLAAYLVSLRNETTLPEDSNAAA